MSIQLRVILIGSLILWFWGFITNWFSDDEPERLISINLMLSILCGIPFGRRIRIDLIIIQIGAIISLIAGLIEYYHPIFIDGMLLFKITYIGVYVVGCIYYFIRWIFGTK